MFALGQTVATPAALAALAAELHSRLLALPAARLRLRLRGWQRGRAEVRCEPITVVGDDHFVLEADGDGIACD
jgi:hypothetical protein